MYHVVDHMFSMCIDQKTKRHLGWTVLNSLSVVLTIDNYCGRIDNLVVSIPGEYKDLTVVTR